jgi:HEAT repeat protein
MGYTHIQIGVSMSGRTITKVVMAGMLLCGVVRAQSPAKPADASAGDADYEPNAAALSLNSTPEERSHEAWKLLEDAVGDHKHAPVRIEALAALGMLRGVRAEKSIRDGMADTDVDVRTAAVLAAGQTRDPNMTTRLRDALDDKEPQVVFTAATVLWRMNDHSGEDILRAVVDGERGAGPTLVNGARHTISKDLHDPTMLARMAAMQAASMFLGPFGYGLTAYEYIRKNGGDLARAGAIDLIAQERTEPIHQEIVAALGDKNFAVRAAAAKGLVDYRDEKTQLAVYALFADAKYPVRLTAAAAYLRTAGEPGPSAQVRVVEIPTAARAPAVKKR